MKESLPDDVDAPIKKRNRVKRLSPKIHKIHHESGRSTKGLWRKIVERSSKQG